MLAAAMLWSVAGVVAKRLDLDAGSIAVYRSLFAGLALLAVVHPRRWAFRPAMVPLGLVFGAMIGLYLGAVKSTTAANAIFLQYTAPFWIVPLGLIFLHERPDPRSLWGIGLATLGVVAIVGYGIGPGETRGVLLALASGVAYAGVVVTLRSLRGLDPLWLSGFANLAGAAVLALWLRGHGRGPGAADLGPGRDPGRLRRPPDGDPLRSVRPRPPRRHRRRGRPDQPARARPHPDLGRPLPRRDPDPRDHRWGRDPALGRRPPLLADGAPAPPRAD